MSLILATYTESEWSLPFVFELEAKAHRVKPIARVEQLPATCARPSHFVPWFLLDVLSEAAPSPVVFVKCRYAVTAELIKAAIESQGADVSMIYVDRHPTSDVVCLSNEDVTRDLLDAWVEQNDRNPGREADVNLREIVRRYRTRVRIGKLDRKVLHDRSVGCTIP